MGYLVMKEVSWSKLTFLALYSYLLLSLNVAGIFAHGKPPVAGVDGEEDHNFDSEQYAWNSGNSAEEKSTSYSSSFPTFEGGDDYSILSKRNSQQQQEGAFKPSPPVGANSDSSELPHHLRPEPVLGIDLSSIEKKVEKPAPVVRPQNRPRPQRRQQQQPHRQQQQQQHRQQQQQQHGNSISRFDVFGDYDFVDPRVPIPSPVAQRRPVTQYYRGRPEGHVQYRRPPPQQQQQQQQQQPQEQGLLSSFLQPFKRVDVRPLPRPLQQQQPQLHHQQQQLQQQPQPQQQTVPYHEAVLNQVPVATKAPFSLKNSLLGLIGLKSTPTPVTTSNNNNNNIIPVVKPEHQESNSVDADYYADYEGGAYFPPPRPPTISDKVAKWFKGFKPPPDLLSPRRRVQQKRRKQQQQNGGLSIDYDQYDTGEDQNLIFYNNNNNNNSGEVSSDLETNYDFRDVLDSIRNNASKAEIFKKVLSAAAALSERSSSSPTFMLWTIPTTLLAILGLFYFISAVAIVMYQATLGNGVGSNIALTVAALAIPLLIAIFVVVTRSSLNGQIDVKRVFTGDLRQGVRQDFDGVDFTLDAVFGSAALLGVGWLFSIAI